MSGLAHLFERQGIATTLISLIRVHSEKMAPPRALWVPFGLGRPFGPANDDRFQRRVVSEALGLLERGSGPILEDFPDEEPETEGEQAGWTCPINFAREAEDLSGAAAIKRTLLNEISQMQPWYDYAVSSRGRTTVRDTAESMVAIAELFASMFEEELPQSPDPDRTLADAIRVRAEDLKAFMLESASAQPGSPSADQLNDWFWNETKTAEVFQQMRQICIEQDDQSMRLLGNLLLVPWSRVGAIDLSDVPK